MNWSITNIMTFRGCLSCFRSLQTPCWLIQVSVTSHLMDNKLRWNALKANICYTIRWLPRFLLWHEHLWFVVLLLSASFSKHLQLRASASTSSISSSILVRFCNSVENENKNIKIRKLCEFSRTVRCTCHQGAATVQ